MFARGTAGTGQNDAMTNKKSQSQAKTVISIKHLRSEGFWRTTWNIITCLERYNPFMLLVSLAVSWLLSKFVDYYLDDIDTIIAICLDYCPKLIAFGIAIYVFLLIKITPAAQKLVTHQLDEKKSVINIFVSTLIWFVFIAFAVLFIAFLSQITRLYYIYIVLYGLVFYTAFLFIDLLLHMYSFHTFIYPKNEIIDER